MEVHDLVADDPDLFQPRDESGTIQRPAQLLPRFLIFQNTSVVTEGELIEAGDLLTTESLRGPKIQGRVSLVVARGVILGVRGTLDIDLYRQTTRDAAEADVRRAARADIGDWFTFEIGAGTPISNDATRLPVNALIGATTWIRFHLDLVGTAVQMTGQPEDVPPLARGLIPDVAQRGYRAYPLVDHVADKIAATYERYGTSRMPSTRYRDLVDLVAIITGASVDATAQRTALESEFARRRLVLPDHFEVPDRTLWTSGYSAEARRSLLGTARTLDDALTVVRPYTDPLLQGTAHGTWHSGRGSWA